MRKLASFHFMSVDGVVESPDQFVGDGLFAEIVTILSNATRDQDAVLLGRKLYEEWSQYWPTSTVAPFNKFINAVRKHVISNTLAEVSWNNATLLQGDLATAMGELKSSDGGTICVHGSVELTQSLLALGLIDEVRLVQFPAIAGRGRRLLEGSQQTIHLTLDHSHRTPKGIEYLVYSVHP